MKNGLVELKMWSANSAEYKWWSFVFICNENNLRTLISFLSHSVVVNFTMNQWQCVKLLLKLFHLVNCALSHITFQIYSFCFRMFLNVFTLKITLSTVYAQINWIHISTLSTLVFVSFSFLTKWQFKHWHFNTCSFLLNFTLIYERSNTFLTASMPLILCAFSRMSHWTLRL